MEMKQDFWYKQYKRDLAGNIKDNGDNIATDTPGMVLNGNHLFRFGTQPRL